MVLDHRYAWFQKPWPDLWNQGSPYRAFKDFVKRVGLKAKPWCARLPAAYSFPNMDTLAGICRDQLRHNPSEFNKYHAGVHGPFALPSSNLASSAVERKNNRSWCSEVTRPFWMLPLSHQICPGKIQRFLWSLLIFRPSPFILELWVDEGGRGTQLYITVLHTPLLRMHGHIFFGGGAMSATKKAQKSYPRWRRGLANELAEKWGKHMEAPKAVLCQ